MRIIAGTHRSRLLKSLKGPALRPTSDYVRETLFNILGPAIQDSRFLDIYAGTGAVGIEALSRGAVHSTFIEHHKPAATLIRQNLDSLQLTRQATILPLDAAKGLEKLAASKPVPAPFDFIFIDPPYADKSEYDQILTYLASPAAKPLLSLNTLIIAEHHTRYALPKLIANLHQTRTHPQGDTTLTFYRLQ
jgi:16S rRNA (guanine966-N2)-methyltransferase